VRPKNSLAVSVGIKWDAAPIHRIEGPKSCWTPSQNQHRLGPAQLKMAESIGEKLRLARETRGVALRDISEQTRISMRFLEAIEADDYRRLPGGIFNRSFIRAYAKFIGYDEQEAMDEYARTMRERGQPDDDSDKPHRSLVYTDESYSRSPLTTLVLALIILAVLSLCVWAGLHFYQRSVAPKTRPETGQLFAPGNPPASTSHANQVHHTSRLLLVPNIWKTKEGEHEFTV
jgi:cytoskeletal protein RodZ